MQCRIGVFRIKGTAVAEELLPKGATRFQFSLWQSDTLMASFYREQQWLIGPVFSVEVQVFPPSILMTRQAIPASISWYAKSDIAKRQMMLFGL